MNDLEHDKMVKTHMKLNQIIDNISSLEVFPSLMWVWTWDSVKEKLNSFGPDSGEEYVVNKDLTEEDVFKLFWLDIDNTQFSLEYGSDQLDEAIFDWMLDKDIIVALDDDGWLDDSEEIAEGPLVEI